MTYLKFIWASSCIGGIISLITSLDSLQSGVHLFSTAFVQDDFSTDPALQDYAVSDHLDSIAIPINKTPSLFNVRGFQRLITPPMDLIDAVLAPNNKLTASMHAFTYHDSDALFESEAFDSIATFSESSSVNDLNSISLSLSPIDDPVEQKKSVEVVLVSRNRKGESVKESLVKLDRSYGISNRAQYHSSPFEHCSLTSPLTELQKSPSSEITARSIHSEMNLSIAQVRVNDHLVAEFSQQGDAYHFAESIRVFLRSADFRPDSIEPNRKGTTLNIATQSSSLPISDSVIEMIGYPSDIVAIAWANNLRVALGGEPLSMGEAQAHIQKLDTPKKTVKGIASWYGPYFHGRITASGEPFDQYALTAAHPTLPFGTHLKVTNMENGHTVVVRINDRGPYIGRRSLDLSKRAAQCLGSKESGVVPYSATILELDKNISKLQSSSHLN